MTTCARYFAAWIRTALPGARVYGRRLRRWARGTSLGYSFDGRPIALTIAQSEAMTASRYTVRAGIIGRMLPSASEEALMQEELGILGPDPVYERVLTV